MVDFGFDFRRRDFEFIMAHLRARAAELSDDKWTDYLNSDIGTSMVQSLVAINEFDAFFTDASLAECFLSTCISREAAIRKSKELGYIPGLAKPAVCQVRLNFPEFNEEITIPARTAWMINETKFTCLHAIVIPPGQTSVDITLTQGTSYSLPPLTSTGSRYFKILVPRNCANIVVKVDNTEWLAVDSWIRPPQQTVYKRYEDLAGQLISFGAKNASTFIPEAGQIINVMGILTDGRSGNIESRNGVVRLVSLVYDSDDNDVTSTFSAHMLSAALGGDDVESIESIKENAPKFYSAQFRAVTEDDYEAIVSRIPGVTSVRATGGEKIGRYGEVLLVVYGETPYSVTQDLIDLITDTLEKMDVVTITKVIKGPVVLELDITLNAGLDRNVFVNESTAVNLLSEKTTDYMHDLGIAANFHASAASAVAKSIEGIKFADYTFMITSSATSTAGRIIIPIAKNADLTQAVLRKQDGTVAWSGDGTAKIINNRFTHIIEGLADQTMKLIYTSDDRKNIEVLPDQICWLNDLEIDAEFET